MTKAIERRRWRLRPLDPRSVAVLLGAVACLARRVATAILAKVDLEPAIFFPVAHTLNGLDGVGNVGEVDKGTALLTQGVDQLDLTVLRKVLAKAVLRPRIVEVAHIHIARGTAAHGQRNSRW